MNMNMKNEVHNETVKVEELYESGKAVKTIVIIQELDVGRVNVGESLESNFIVTGVELPSIIVYLCMDSNNYNMNDVEVETNSVIFNLEEHCLTRF